MARNYKGPGESIEISGLTADVSAGSLYRRTGGAATAPAWIGVVTDEVIGTSSTAQTVDGRPILIGDGVAAEAQTGSGKGDMMVEGVFTLRLPTSGTLILDGDPLYAVFSSNVASGVTDNNAAAGLPAFGPISGACVGFAVGANYTATAAPFNGMNVVDVKLLGLPMQSLHTTAP